MNKFLSSALCFLLPVLSVFAQAPDSLELARNRTLAEARYLKSIYKIDEAIDTLSRCVGPESFDAEIFSELADCHFMNGNYMEAAVIWQMLELQDPDKLIYKVKQMQTAYRMKDYLACATFGNQILAVDSIPAIAALTGDALNLAGQRDSALVLYRQALVLKPVNESVVSKAANLLLSAKDYAGVIEMADAYLSLDPDNPPVASIRGLAYYLDGVYDSSAVVFQRLEDMGQDTYPVHYYLGQSYWHTKELYRAEPELLTAWAIDSSDVNLAYTIAAVMSDYHKSFREIEPWLARAVEMIRPDSLLVSRIYQQYAVGHYRQSAYQEAIPYFKDAYRYNPELVSNLSNIAFCYEQLKQYRTALEWYEKYLSLVPPGSRGYEYARKSIEYIKGELFMMETRDETDEDARSEQAAGGPQ